MKAKSDTQTGLKSGRPAVLKVTVFAALLLLALPAIAQRKSDIGFMVAVPWYQGDLSTFVPRPSANPPAIGPLYRYNFNPRNSLRAHAVFYSLSYELDGDQLLDQPQHLQGLQGFSPASFVDLGLDFEFNWWPYKTAWRKTKYSPYVTAGLGYSINYDGQSVSHLYLPFGGGVKANLGKRMSGGLEVSMRKSFSDLLDGVANFGSEGNTPVGNNDWYMFTGVFISYKIFEYREPCPAMETEQNYSMRKGRSKRRKGLN